MNRIKQKLTECTAVVKHLTRSSLQLKRLRKSILLKFKQDLPQMLPAFPCCKPLPCLMFQPLQGSLVLLLLLPIFPQHHSLQRIQMGQLMPWCQPSLRL